jgi:phosphate-selective porin OprO and OprP
MSTPLLPSFAILAALGTACAFGAEATIEDRLRALEQTVQQLTQENAELKRQLGGKETTPPVLARPSGPVTRLAVGGFLQAHAEFGDAPEPRWVGVNDRFFFRRARIFVAGTFAEHFDFKAELDLQGNTLGASTGNLARANEVYLTWTRHPAAHIRFGQLKPAYGAEALQSDTKTVFIERTYGNDRLADGRNLALGLHGTAAGSRLAYSATLANGNGSNVSANDNERFQPAARLTFTPWSDKAGSLTLGVNGLRSTDNAVSKSGLGLTGNSFTGRRTMWGVDAALRTKPVEFQAEVLGGTFRPANAVPAREFDALAWHAHLAWNAVPGRLQLALRREEFDPNTAVGGDGVEVWNLGLNWFIRGDDLKLQFNWLDGSGPGTAGDGGRLLTRMQVVF